MRATMLSEVGFEELQSIEPFMMINGGVFYKILHDDLEIVFYRDGCDPNVYHLIEHDEYDINEVREVDLKAIIKNIRRERRKMFRKDGCSEKDVRRFDRYVKNMSLNQWVIEHLLFQGLHNSYKVYKVKKQYCIICQVGNGPHTQHHMGRSNICAICSEGFGPDYDLNSNLK